MSFKDLKLAQKQKIGFGFMLLILAAVNIFSIRKMAGLKNQIDEVSKNWLPRAIAISDINRNTSDLRINQLQHAFARDSVTKQQQEAIMVSLIDKIDNNLDTYEALKKESEDRDLYSEQERHLYEEFNSKWEAYQDLSFVFFNLSRDHENQKAIELLNGEAQVVFNEMGKILEELVIVNKTDATNAANRAETTYNATKAILTSLLIVTIILSIFLAVVLVRFITIPVQELEKAARRVADGDLDVQLEILTKDEIGCLASSFNQMTTSLKQAKQKMQQQSEILQAKNKDLENALYELKNTQQQLMMKEKMAALGDLVAGIAHEINNPIGTINSSIDVSERCVNRIELLLKRVESIDQLKKNDQFRDMLTILRNNIDITLIAGNRIATIIQSLKNFARLDESEYKIANINEGIENTLTLLGNELRTRVSVVKDYGEIPNIGCYPGQLNQVFMNLLKNALQAIEDLGTIHIKTFKQNKHIQIEISDTGKGIPKNRLDKVFDFNFSTSDSRIKLGSGLVTAYNIIQNHDGEIKVESEEKKGTTFSIILPIKK